MEVRIIDLKTYILQTAHCLLHSAFENRGRFSSGVSPETNKTTGCFLGYWLLVYTLCALRYASFLFILYPETRILSFCFVLYLPDFRFQSNIS
jgi:hypothetical protein